MDAGARETTTSIAACLTVSGDVASDGDVLLDGKVVGDITCKALRIGRGATVNGAIKADFVYVAGTVSGRIGARTVELSATAHVEGDIHHESLAVEAGAYVEGLCRHVGSSKPPPADGERPSLVVASGGTA